ncbi:hypothetical protein DRO69_12470 [Candidatus Bathyarchaeota archaeon]|nr:MAG: hypothetical protein DRO69_12470 [Candidatus Bathyarchaeota archaeon]
MKCYNCNKIEKIVKIGKGLVSDIERIETDLKECSDEEEKFMPLCQKCLKDWQDGKLKGIEEKWISEKNKWEYISLE